MSPSFLLSLAGLLLAALGVVMPWYSYELLGQDMTFKALGTSTGWILIVFTLLSFAMAYLGKKQGSRGKFVGTLVLALLAFLVVAANHPSRAPIDGIEAQTGYYLALLGTMALGLGGLVGTVKKG